jgi:hypothetical protein
MSPCAGLHWPFPGKKEGSFCLLNGGSVSHLMLILVLLTLELTVGADLAFGAKGGVIHIGDEMLVGG